jgi:ribosomal protein L40E
MQSFNSIKNQKWFKTEEIPMVYCTKCGTENKEDARFCAKCGAELYPEKRRERREEDTCFGPREKHFEEECFGIPHGGAIVGIIFGAFVIILGLGMALGLDIGAWIGGFFLIVVGLLIVIAAIFAFRRLPLR